MALIKASLVEQILHSHKITLQRKLKVYRHQVQFNCAKTMLIVQTTDMCRNWWWWWWKKWNWAICQFSTLFCIWLVIRTYPGKFWRSIIAFWVNDFTLQHMEWLSVASLYRECYHTLEPKKLDKTVPTCNLEKLANHQHYFFIRRCI